MFVYVCMGSDCIMKRNMSFDFILINIRCMKDTIALCYYTSKVCLILSVKCMESWKFGVITSTIYSNATHQQCDPSPM